MNSLTTYLLTKKYAGVPAVNSVSVQLETGKIYGLLGPNGSGKSTFMKMAAGLVHPTEGKIEVLGKPAGPEARANVAFMPTEPYFYGYMTVEQVGCFHRDFYSDFDMETYRGLVGSMGLASGMKMNQLSSGMAAKLKVTVAASRNAGLIMFDEPLNGIDLLARDVIIKTMIEKASENNTILISSHLIDTLETVLDEVLFLDRGSVILQGGAEQMRQQYGKSIVDLYREVYQAC